MSQLEGKTPWEFACGWYTPGEIERSIKHRNASETPGGFCVPADIYSQEFADWLTEQYRLAMTKGIEIGIRHAYSFREPPHDPEQC